MERWDEVEPWRSALGALEHGEQEAAGGHGEQETAELPILQ